MSQKFYFRLLCFFAFFALASQVQAQQTFVSQGQLIRVTPKLADLNPDPRARNANDIVRDVYGLVSMRGVERQFNNVFDPTGKPHNGDPIVQRSFNRNRNGADQPGGPDQPNGTEGVEVITQFDGQGFTNVSPADPTLCVGQNHIIQMINGASGSKFRIFDKNGTPVSAQTDLDQLPGAGFFGQGDPIALYDQMADRYFLGEFGNITGSGNPSHLIICISQTNNPTGAWYVYRFETTGIFPDYPKFGIWSNCYTATTNDFTAAGTAFLGCSMYAFDRTKMLAGDATATMIRVALTTPFVGQNRSLIPISHTGSSAPPANTPALFSFYNDDATTAITTDVDSISFISYLPNFATPANSVFTRLPSLVPAPFKGVVCGSRNCAPGCNGSAGYDVLDSRNMFPANWRRFPGYDAVTICHTVDANAGIGSPKAGIRWYEFRNTGSGWTIHQQSTLAPDANFRYMPSMAMNGAGQICLGYNLSGANACSSIFFTGRNSADPLNTMTFEENGARCGTGYGTFGNRWGDYNHMNSDPAPGQDSIFWFTAMYGQTNWNTRILKMKMVPNVQFDARAEAVSINVPGVLATGHACAAPTAPSSFILCTPSATPYVIVRNRGTQAITALNIKYSDNGVVTTFPQTGLNITTGNAQQFTLNPPYNATPGAHTVKAWTETPNGQPDQNTPNDTAYATFTVINPPPLPTSNNFVSTTFPGAGYSIVNPNANNTWVRNNAGNGNVGSAFIDNFNFNLNGQTDDLRTQSLSFTGSPDSIVVQFDIAYKNFPGFNDRLQLLVSNDCGNTFVPTGFDRAGAALATAGSSTASYTTPVAADWRRQRVAVGGAALLAPRNLTFAWRMTNAFGNNLFIDNINVAVKVDRDLAVTAINRPADVECSPSFTPQVVVTNTGTQATTSFRVGYFLDAAGPFYTAPITTALAVGASTTVTLPVATSSAGNRSFRAFTADLTTAGGTGDQQPGNDTLTKPFLIRTIYNAPISENFVSTVYPSPDWGIINPNANITWVRNNAGNGNPGSSFIDNFNFNLVGQTDDIRTPPINTVNVDSLILFFDVAHKNFTGFDDRLQVLVSSDCGSTFQLTSYNKAGAVLATAGSSTTNYTTPSAGDWRRERVAIGGAALASGNVIIVLRNINGYGNNTFVENIIVSAIYKRDIELSAVTRPVNECNTSFPPSVRVTNKGSDTVKSFSVSYSIDNILPVTVTNITGLNLAPNASQVFALTNASAAVGQHSIRAFTHNLVTNGGAGDLNPLNDTTAQTFNVFGTENAPLVEGFEGNQFIPAKWGIMNADGLITWARTTAAGSNSNASASMNNFNYTGANGQRDELITPMVAFTGVDSVYLKFDVAARTRRYPGSTQLPIDTLEVLITKDCGNTYTSLWKKWGEELQTVNDPNSSSTLPFTPTRFDWKTVKLNISALAGATSNNVQVVFRSSSNGDNNVFIDNVNLSTLTLPERLKRDGYLIYPSPFTSNVTIQHYLAPTSLRAVQVFNARGQLVASRDFGTGGANSNETMDLSALASGVYTFKLIYTNKEIVERVVKTN